MPLQLAIRRVRRSSRPPQLFERSLGRLLGVVVLWCVVGLTLLAFGWMFIQSIRDTREILVDPWGLPKSISFENYVSAWTISDFGLATYNTVVTSVVSSILTILLAAPAAYYLARVDTRFSRGASIYFLLGLGIPAQVILIPLFVMLNAVYLTDSLVGLNAIYVAVSLPFAVFLLTAFFRTIPGELEEAAALDGASPARTFWRIAFPLARGGVITVFALQFIAHWNETLFALTFLQSTENYTLPVALISFVQQQTYSGANWGGMFAGLCIVALPTIFLYGWLGKYLTEGLTLGIGK
jgi:N-acetylglucosamine transport system permease protein